MVEINPEQRRALIQIYERGDCISFDIYSRILLKHPRGRGPPILGWSQMDPSRVPPAYHVKDLFRDQVLETLEWQGVVDSQCLNEGRLQLLKRSIEYTDDSYWSLPLTASDPKRLHEEARLYQRMIEVYYDRTDLYASTNPTRWNLEVIEVLAAKLAYRVTLQPQPQEQWAILDSFLEIYRSGISDVVRTFRTKPSAERDALEVAEQAIFSLFPQRIHWIGATQC